MNWHEDLTPALGEVHTPLWGGRSCGSRAGRSLLHTHGKRHRAAGWVICSSKTLCEGKIDYKTWVCQPPLHLAETFKLFPDTHLVLNPPPISFPLSPFMFFLFLKRSWAVEIKPNRITEIGQWSPRKDQPGSCTPKGSWACGVHTQLADLPLPISEGPWGITSNTLQDIHFSSFIYKIKAAQTHLSNRISSHRSCRVWFSDQGS